MRSAFVLPGGTATEQLEQAVLAEEHGWDAVFVWEAAYGIDAWTLLAAMAARTQRIRLGTMLTPLPWRRPWKLASQVTTLDQISGGRAVLTVGLGAVDNSLGNTGEVVDRRQRAAMLDEGLDVVQGLWRGELTHRGAHYDVDLSGRTDLASVAQTVQQPIPIWVVGAWQRPRSMQRVLRCEGLVPVCMDDHGFRDTVPADVVAIREWLRRHGKPDDFDIVIEGVTPADDPHAAREHVSPWTEAGATWWLEARWELPHEAPERMRAVRERLQAGPPVTSPG